MEFHVSFTLNDLHRRRFSHVDATTDNEIKGLLRQAAQDHVDDMLETADRVQRQHEREAGLP